MRQLILLLIACLAGFSISAQLLKINDAVEVDILMGDSVKNQWKKASVIHYDSATKVYQVKILDGDKMNIPSHNPEKWIRPLGDKRLGVQYGPESKIPFQSRVSAMQPVDCRPTEKFIKKNLRSLMAAEYKDFDAIYVEFPKYKPQHGYDDPNNKGQFIYPYELEWRVYLKRTVLMGGRLYTEFQTWEYDREYAYATRGKKKCDFYPLEMDPPVLLSRGWFVVE